MSHENEDRPAPLAVVILSAVVVALLAGLGVALIKAPLETLSTVAFGATVFVLAWAFWEVFD